MKPRIVIAGFGDTGLLVAIHLSKHFDILGVSPKPCLVSGQELGLRLTQPQAWKRDYLMPYQRYRKLDSVRTLQGLISAIDSDRSTVTVTLADGTETVEPYDALVIASGVTNGFWRNNALADLATINADIDKASQQLLAANSAAIIGGGATGVSVAANLAAQHPQKAVHFFFSQDQPLPGYHPRVRTQVTQHLRDVGVQLYPQHRAQLPPGFSGDRLTTEPVNWSSGQDDFQADITLWALGKVTPNNSFVPADMLNRDGFVKADEFLRVPGYNNIFTVGDIAATDPNRSSARNWGYRLLGHNIRASLQGKPARMKPYSAPKNRWGSIYGVQDPNLPDSGLRVFQPDGGSFRFPLWSVQSLLFPLAVRKMIYKGVRRP
jgi:NADH dehydrogenase FAD-containing subunit